MPCRLNVCNILLHFDSKPTYILITWSFQYIRSSKNVALKIALQTAFWRQVAIVWAKIRHLIHFVQNLSGVKIHASCKILNLCQHFGVTKTHVGKNFWIWIFFYLKRQSYRYYQKKWSWAHIIFIHKSYNEIVDKIAK